MFAGSVSDEGHHQRLQVGSWTVRRRLDRGRRRSRRAVPARARDEVTPPRLLAVWILRGWRLWAAAARRTGFRGRDAELRRRRPPRPPWLARGRCRGAVSARPPQRFRGRRGLVAQLGVPAWPHRELRRQPQLPARARAILPPTSAGGRATHLRV